MVMTMRWTLPADHSSARLARDHIARELGDIAAADDIVLAASELVTNAVEHGSPPVELELEVREGTVRVTVTNGSDGGTPREREAAVDDTGGRGLAMVALLATRWGWDHDHRRVEVWAEFDPV